MRGMLLAFTKKIQQATDEMNNPISRDVIVNIEDCLVAPMSEPSNTREEQAMNQATDKVRVHLPKSYTGDISNSTFVYGGKIFQVDSDGVELMPENTPTRWNRYFSAEYVANYIPKAGYLFDGILSEDSLFYFIDETNHYYFAQEVVI